MTVDLFFERLATMATKQTLPRLLACDCDERRALKSRVEKLDARTPTFHK